MGLPGGGGFTPSGGLLPGVGFGRETFASTTKYEHWSRRKAVLVRASREDTVEKGELTRRVRVECAVQGVGFGRTAVGAAFEVCSVRDRLAAVA